MSAWQPDELQKIAETDDLRIAVFYEDGVSHGTLTWIWSVVVGDSLYVRAYYGTDSRWFQSALRQKAGRIAAAGMTKDVDFEHIDGPIQAQIDDAYRKKYGKSPYLSSMIGTRARATTMNLTPR